MSVSVIIEPSNLHDTPTLFCIPRRDHQASAQQDSNSSEQLRSQIPALLPLDHRPANRGARKRRNADPQEDKRHPHALPRRVVRREPPDDEVVQPLHGTGEEAVEARDDDDGGVARGADPEEEEDGRQEDARDDGVGGAEVAVGEEGGEQAAREVGRVHEDEEVDGRGAVEVQVGLSVCDDEVEAEVDAPEGEEEAWESDLV